MTEMVTQREVAADLGGMLWSEARRFAESLGIRVYSDGPRRWLVLREDWQPVRDRLDEVRAARRAS